MIIMFREKKCANANAKNDWCAIFLEEYLTVEELKSINRNSIGKTY